MPLVAAAIAAYCNPDPSETPPSPKNCETGVGPTSWVRSPTPCAAHGVTYCLQQTGIAAVKGFLRGLSAKPVVA